MLLRRAAQLPPRRRPLLGVSLRRWARLCPAVDRMERVGGQSNGRETDPVEANAPHTRHAGAVDARALHSSDTFFTYS